MTADPYDLERFVAAQGPVVTAVLDRYLGGDPDPRTLELLG